MATINSSHQIASKIVIKVTDEETSQQLAPPTLHRTQNIVKRFKEDEVEDQVKKEKILSVKVVDAAQHAQTRKQLAWSIKLFQLLSLKFLRLPFSTLRRQVVIICRPHGLPPLYRWLNALFYALFVGRYLTISLCLYFRCLNAYFKVDPEYLFAVRLPAYRPITIYSLLITCFATLFNARLFVLLYLTPDRTVWAHLYDLLVRNQAAGKSLLYYPTLEPQIRRWCRRVTALCELVMPALVAYYAAFYYFYSKLVFVRPSPPQLVFCLLMTAISVLYHALLTVMYFLVTLTLYLVCVVYTQQYRPVNDGLAKLKTTLYRRLVEKQHPHPLQLLSLAGAAYRSAHAHLTAFILRYNESIVSKVIAYYLHYLLPYHAYYVILVTVRRRTIKRLFAVYFAVFLGVALLLLLVITLCVAQVNAALRRSGPTLAAVLVLLGSSTQKKIGTGRKRSSSELHFGAWQQETFKLSTYYELIWRNDKELAFTAGQGNTPMNWKYVSEVAFLYTVFVLFFLSKFINNKDGFKA